MGEKYYLSTTAGYLAAALLQQDETTRLTSSPRSASGWRHPTAFLPTPFGETSAAGCSLAMGSLKRADSRRRCSPAYRSSRRTRTRMPRSGPISPKSSSPPADRTRLGLRSKTQPRSWKRRGTSYPRPRQGAPLRGPRRGATSPRLNRALDRKLWSSRAGLANGIFEWIEAWYNPQPATPQSATCPQSTTKPFTRPPKQRHDHYAITDLDPVFRTRVSRGLMLG